MNPSESAWNLIPSSIGVVARLSSVPGTALGAHSVQGQPPAGAIVRANNCDTVCGTVPLSVTRKVKLNVPAAVGVPSMIPFENKLSPGGRLPETNDQL